jgi:threonine dehydratase
MFAAVKCYLMYMLNEYKKLISEACGRVYAVARETSLDIAPELSRRHNNNIWLKREDQQPVFSYKLRGAFNLMATLSEEAKQQGVIAASAGNHAQGVALAADKLGIEASIIMPKTTPEIKITAVKRLGANVILHGNTYDEAKDHAVILANEKSMAFIPPYDHPIVIAGQATVGVEILKQHPGMPDIIFIPVGGGGLIAGIAAHVKEQNPDIKIIGVEPDEAPCMHHALSAGERVLLDNIGIFADGAAVRQAGEEPFRVARELVDEMLLVTNDEICAAVKDIFEDTRSIPEPAGALALAGLKQYVSRESIKDKELVAIFSGANVNFDRLRHIAELSALGENREALIGTTIPERPGSFRIFCHDLGPRLITEFNYRYADKTDAHVFAGIQLRHGTEEKNTLIQQLTKKGYEVIDLSNDDIAKMHIRYMVGGHAPQAENEKLYRFEFPERSGALLHFLSQMGERWNISLFHYRNHGAAYGRVLMGIQVKEEEKEEFQGFLDGLEIQYWEETNNPAYEMFLS